MSFTIIAEDAEFAVATGSNVGSGDGTSTFDYPPTSSRGLVITSNPDDPSPGTFSVGDTYDLSYGNDGGGKGGTFEDAVVIRSDALPDGGHAVVFEGTNENGELEQIVWTPGFDLEAWYFDNFNQGASPGFYTTDQDAQTQYDHSFVCFSSCTFLTSEQGERRAGDLRPGDRLRTQDHGLQPIVWIGRRSLSIDPCYSKSMPIVFQPNAFAAGKLRRRVIVSPQHRILLHDAQGREHLAPAKSFVGLKGVRYMRGQRQIEYVSIMLGCHAILDASGLATESFLPGPQAYQLLSSSQVKEVESVLRTSLRGVKLTPARPCLGGSSGRRALEKGGCPALFAPRARVTERSDC